MYESLRGHLYTMLRGHLCTPFVCVVKGSPVHLTFVSLRGHLIKFFLELATQMCGILNLQRRHFAICFFSICQNTPRSINLFCCDTVPEFPIEQITEFPSLVIIRRTAQACC